MPEALSLSMVSLTLHTRIALRHNIAVSVRRHIMFSPFRLELFQNFYSLISSV